MKNKKGKLIASLTAAAAAVGMVTFGAITNKANNAAKPGNREEQASSYGETEITSGKSAGIKLMTAKIPVEAYAAYGVSEQAETAYTVTVTPSTEGALTAVVQNVAAFGEQIVVKTVSRDNAEAYATLNVEYLQRTTGYTLTLDGKTYSTTGTKTNSVTPDFSVGKGCKVNIVANKTTVYTRANTDKAEYITVKPTEAFKSALVKAGSDFAPREYGLTSSGLSYGWFDSTFVQGLTNVQKNKLIAAMQGFSGTAYEIVIYTANGGTQLATFGIALDTSVIVGQKGVESVKVDQTELVF